MRCPRCGSSAVRGGAMDTNSGDELQDRWCSACHHSESWLRGDRASAELGLGWYDDDPRGGAPRPITDETERTLLAQIAATPDDDAPRLVYADWLLERDDPRGRFIALQCARAARRELSPSPEERTLLAEHWRGWIGAVGEIARGHDIELERGMWSACDWITQDVAGRFDDTVIDDPAWATVRRLAIPPWLEPLMPRLLEGPRCRSLRVLVVETRAAVKAVAALAPALDELVLLNRQDERPHLPGLAGLRRIAIRCNAATAISWLDAAARAGVPEVTLRITGGVAIIEKLVRRARRHDLDALGIELHARHLIRASRSGAGELAVHAIEVQPASVPSDEDLAAARRHLAALAAYAAPDAVVTPTRATFGLRPV